MVHKRLNAVPGPYPETYCTSYESPKSRTRIPASGVRCLGDLHATAVDGDDDRDVMDVPAEPEDQVPGRQRCPRDPLRLVPLRERVVDQAHACGALGERRQSRAVEIDRTIALGDVAPVAAHRLDGRGHCRGCRGIRSRNAPRINGNRCTWRTRPGPARDAPRGIRGFL